MVRVDRGITVIYNVEPGREPGNLKFNIILKPKINNVSRKLC